MRLTTRQLFPLLLFSAIFLIAIRPIADPDFWWHLRTGEWIVANHAIPETDPYSSTNAGKEWTTHEWLSELTIYGLYRLGGFPLLILFFAAIITISFFLVYQSSLGHPYFAGFTLLLGVIATAPTWGVRPQMLSLFFSSFYMYLLERYSKTHTLKLILPLPFLTIAWVNLHAGFALGLIIIGAYLGKDFMEWLSSAITGSGEKKSIRVFLPLAVIFAFCFLAILANPHGAQMYIYPFQTLTSSAMQAYIQEWFSPNFHLPEWQPLAWTFLALIGLALVVQCRISFPRVLLILIFGYMTLRSMRHVPLFVIVVVPVMAELAEAAFEKIREPYLSKADIKTRKVPLLPNWLNVFIVLLALLAVAGRFVQVIKLQPDIEQKTFPIEAVDWIRTNHPDGKIYNSYDWGGYLIWKLREYPVFIDGRADLYGDIFIESFLDIYRANPGWDEELSNNSVNLVLVDPNSLIGNTLTQSLEWELVFSDEKSLLFLRK